ncbi:hypothetical protein FHX80_133 [Streptomyces brevispora]|uniref:Uncharacterized protein n=1 Tax=Streptomyces brevispora TaxID=887462 RepID=A0A561TU02_9ACTN|nr:hypothetical protein [Streptomyces brevispora]TWF90588.1 hypothetical protein FHX80_133 [Streptomyces brevispora]
MINMSVRGDRGNVVARAQGGVEWTAAFADLDPGEFPMLWALDPYGDAVFNHRQVPLLLAELDRLPAACGGDWVGQARELCQVVQQRVHRYLRFVGD